MQPVLNHLGVTNPDGSVTVSLESPGHKPLMVKVSFTAFQEAKEEIPESIS